jgi:hypothetical protein
MPRANVESLLNLGFRDIGAWTTSGNSQGLEYCLDGANAEGNKGLLDGRNALYAFAQDGEIRYIGKTAQTLRQRFAGYRKPHPGQRTNWRCNGKIREQIEAGATVRILVFVMTSHLSNLRYGDFSINLAAGLEDALIEEFDPPWNGRDGRGPVTEDAEREQEQASTGTGEPPPAPVQPPATPATRAPFPDGVARFRIKLGEAYYRQGIVNPGVDASRHLGGHDDPVTVYLGSMDASLVSRIDRKANPNGSVRVVGGNGRIAKWVQGHFEMGDVIDARVLDQHGILLMPSIRPVKVAPDR